MHEEDPWAYESSPNYGPRHYGPDDEDDWLDRWLDQAFDSHDGPNPYNYYNGHAFDNNDDWDNRYDGYDEDDGWY